MKKFMDLRAARKLKGLSLEKLSELSGVTLLTVSNIERRKTMPNLQTKEKLEAALGVKINWLAGKGLRQIKDDRIQFSAMEYRLRRLIYDLNFLNSREQAEFVSLAKMYLKQYETNRRK